MVARDRLRCSLSSFGCAAGTRLHMTVVSGDYMCASPCTRLDAPPATWPRGAQLLLALGQWAAVCARSPLILRCSGVGLGSAEVRGAEVRSVESHSQAERA
jgi:hypothetical protein